MPTSMRLPSTAAIATLALVGVSAMAPAEPVLATQTTVPQESLVVFEGQLNGHLVRGVTLHTKAHKLHIALTNGSKAVIVLPASEQQRVLADAKAHGVTVKVAKTHPASHKRRYLIIGGVVVVAIALAAVVWLLVRRRRAREEQYGPGVAR